MVPLPFLSLTKGMVDEGTCVDNDEENLLEESPKSESVELASRGSGDNGSKSHCDIQSAAGAEGIDASTTYLRDDIEMIGDGHLEEREMTKWTIMSNSFFFLGSVMYVWTSTVDLVETKPFWMAYKTLSAIAALMYVANSLVDLRVSVKEIRGNVGSGRFGDDPHWEIGVAVTFGIAAICDFLGTLTYDVSPVPAYVAYSTSVHVYLLNAIMVLSGRVPGFSSLPKGLTSGGDMLFLVGSLIDVLISYVDNPEAPASEWRMIAWGSLTSSILWFIDALLYILADVVPTSSNEDDDYVLAHSGDIDEDDLEFSSVVSTQQ